MLFFQTKDKQNLPAVKGDVLFTVHSVCNRADVDLTA